MPSGGNFRALSCKKRYASIAHTGNAIDPRAQLSTKYTPSSSLPRFITPYNAFLTFPKLSPYNHSVMINSKCFDDPLGKIYESVALVLQKASVPAKEFYLHLILIHFWFEVFFELPQRRKMVINLLFIFCFRVQEYFVWAQKVVNGLRDTNPKLESILDELFTQRGLSL